MAHINNQSATLNVALTQPKQVGLLQWAVQDWAAMILRIPVETLQWVWTMVVSTRRFMSAYRDQSLSDIDMRNFLTSETSKLMDTSHLYGGETIVSWLKSNDNSIELMNCYIWMDGEIIFMLPKNGWGPLILPKTEAELRKITIILKLLQEWYRWGALQNSQIHPKNIRLNSSDLNITSLEFLERNYEIKTTKQNGTTKLQIS